MGWVAQAAQAAGGVVNNIETMKNAGSEKDQVEANAHKEQETMRKKHRAEFGSMLAQSGSSGLSGSSFQDIFNNQTIEDSIAMTGLKQKEENLLTAIKNKKRKAKFSLVTGLGNFAAGGYGDMSEGQQDALKSALGSPIKSLGSPVKTTRSIRGA